MIRRFAPVVLAVAACWSAAAWAQAAAEAAIAGASSAKSVAAPTSALDRVTRRLGEKTEQSVSRSVGNQPAARNPRTTRQPVAAQNVTSNGTGGAVSVTGSAANSRQQQKRRYPSEITIRAETESPAKPAPPK